MKNLEIVFDPKMADKEKSIAMDIPTRAELGILIGQRIIFQAGEKEFVFTVIPRTSRDESLKAHIAPSYEEAFKQNKPILKIPEITLGCDPEFFLTRNEHNLMAYYHLPHKGQIGSDGALAELRPTHSLSPEGLVKNLKELILQIPAALASYSDWNTASTINARAYSSFQGIFAGFHLHFGLPQVLISTGSSYNSASLHYLTRCLDWYLSTMALVVDPDNNRRCTVNVNHYGMPGDYRVNNITYEYRVPGAFHLRSPIYSLALISTGALILEYVVAGIKSLSKNYAKLDELKEKDLEGILILPELRVIRSALMEPEKSIATRSVEKIYNTLESLPNYPKHKKGVELLFNLIDTQSSPPDPNLLSNWRF